MDKMIAAIINLVDLFPFFIFRIVEINEKISIVTIHINAHHVLDELKFRIIDNT